MLIWLPHDGSSHDVKMDKQTEVTAGCIVGRLESVLYFMIALTPRHQRNSAMSMESRCRDCECCWCWC
jgi:hypothetical protein